LLFQSEVEQFGSLKPPVDIVSKEELSSNKKVSEGAIITKFNKFSLCIFRKMSVVFECVWEQESTGNHLLSFLHGDEAAREV
jgi:hypothetical protein